MDLVGEGLPVLRLKEDLGVTVLGETSSSKLGLLPFDFAHWTRSAIACHNKQAVEKEAIGL